MNWVIEDKYLTADLPAAPRGVAAQAGTQRAQRMDDLVQGIGELAGETRKLARDARRRYSAEVNAILKARSRDSKRIERCLDGMLDFCFDDDLLALYRKLCRYYFTIDQGATASYVRAYRVMWGR